MATWMELKPAAMEHLNELIQINMDTASGFRRAAAITENPTLKSMFYELGGQRARFVEELKEKVPEPAENIPTSGTWFGKAHHWWMDLRSTVSPDTGYALLAEVERSEERLKSAYEALDRETVGTAVHPLLSLQYDQICKIHEQIRGMREVAGDSRSS